MFLVVDTSHWDPNLDWVQAKQAGVVGMYTKATDGFQYIDPSLLMHVHTAQAAGVSATAFHFLRANDDGKTQASLFLKTIKTLRLDWAPILDWEEASIQGQSAAVQIKQAQAWLDTVESALGVTPAIYLEESVGLSLGLPESFKRYPLILAHYGVPEAELHVPQPWSTLENLTAWQYTDSASIPGVAPGHTIDANRFYMPLPGLKAPQSATRDLPTLESEMDPESSISLEK